MSSIPPARRAVLTRGGIVIALALAVASLAGCGDNGTGPGAAEKGTYQLVEVNGSALPVVVHSEETGDGLIEFRLVQGSVALDGDRYESLLRNHFVVDDAVLRTDELKDAGSYTISGTTITFKSDTGSIGTFTGTLEDRTLTVESVHEEYGSILAVYRR